MKLCAVAVLFLSVTACAGEPRDEPLDRLKVVQQLAFGGIGYAGIISQGEKDYKVILSRQSALADFERLYSAGNLQAKSYALIGIHRIDSKKFEELARTARISKDEVTIERGCIVSREPLGTIIGRIERDEYPSK